MCIWYQNRLLISFKENCPCGQFSLCFLLQFVSAAICIFPCFCVNTNAEGVVYMDGQELVKQTLDQIPQANANAKRIVGLVKESGRITGYQLSDNTVVEKQQAVNMAKQGQIAGVGIAHRGDTEYLKSIPDGSENNNLGNLPSVTAES